MAELDAALCFTAGDGWHLQPSDDLAKRFSLDTYEPEPTPPEVLPAERVRAWVQELNARLLLAQGYTSEHAGRVA